MAVEEAGQIRAALNAGLRDDEKRRQGGCPDGQDKVRVAFSSVGCKRWSAQTPSFPLSLPPLSPYGAAGNLLLWVISQDPRWTTLPRVGVLEVSRASSTSQCTQKT